MVDEAKVEEAVAAPAKAAVPMLPLMIAMMLSAALVCGVLGAAGWWLVKTGRLPVVQGAARAETPAKTESVKSKQIALEPLLVNLADAGGRSYLRVAMTLRVEEPPVDPKAKAKEPEKGKPVNENEAAMRDAALEVLGTRTSAALLAPEGKQTLKDELRTTMQQRVPELKVIDVLFTEFLVQQ